LDAAIEYFATYARGSSYKKYVQQLTDQCTRLWHDGRQLCEAISLTGNPCKNEVRKWWIVVGQTGSFMDLFSYIEHLETKV